MVVIEIQGLKRLSSKLSQMVELPNDNAGSKDSKVSGRLMLQMALYLLLGLIPVISLSLLLVGLEASALSLSLGFYLVGSLLIFLLLKAGYPHISFGFGNLVTLSRFFIVAALVSSLIVPANAWLVVSLALTSLILDGVDGYLARKEGLVSDFGARLDMEVDSVLALVLALNLWLSGITGPVILLLGLPRYLFVFAAYWLPWLKKPLPYSFSRRVISVVQIASLIGLHAPILPELLIIPVSWIVAGLLIWSFGRDVNYLWRRRS